MSGSTYTDAVARLLDLYSSGAVSANDTASSLAGLRPAYGPTFREPVRGKYDPRAAVAALNVGSDAYVTERELNEAQWIRREEVAALVREITRSGVLVASTEATTDVLAPVDMDEEHTNSLSLPVFRTVVNGHLVLHVTTNDDGTDRDRVYVRLPNPPVAGVRQDLVYIEYWLEELRGDNVLPAYGCVDNQPTGYVILDERVDAETSRRIQLQWRIAVYEDYDGQCTTNGLVDQDGQAITRLIPRNGLARPLRTYSYERVPDDPGLFRAGNGVPMDSQVNTVDGWVYAMPLFLVTRLNNSGYDEASNPTGGVDYVDSSTDCDRPDGRYANVVYADYVKPMYTEAHLGPVQLDRLYLKLVDYREHMTALRNKVNRLTQDMENVDNVLRAQGYALPGVHDLEIYGHRMYRQYVITSGASMDDDEHKVIYRRRRYAVGRELAKRDYAVLPTLVDYDYQNIGALGDLYVVKKQRYFTVFNTGGHGLRLDTTAVHVDGDAVISGEAQFMGMDGAVIQLPFTVDPERHLVHVCPLEDTNGQNGEIFVRAVDQEMIVYNTGLTVNKRGEQVYTAGNGFQWTVIDTFHPNWRNCSMTLVTLNGQDGVRVANNLFGENYRVVAGTPVFNASQLATEGSIGEVYINTEEDNEVTVYNSGSPSDDTVMPRVQVLVFHEVPYVEYYDVLDFDEADLPVVVDAPKATSEVDDLRAELATAKETIIAMGSQLTTTRSQLAALSAMVNAEDKDEFTLSPGAEHVYTIPASMGTSINTSNTSISLLVVDDAPGSLTNGMLVSADAVADMAFPDDGRTISVRNVSDRQHRFTLLLAYSSRG